MTKEMKALIKACERAGLVYDPHGKHPKLRNPKTGQVLAISKTPSRPYAHREVLRDLKKYWNLEIKL